MSSKVGIGILGTGFARRVQIPAFRACENAWVVSVASGSAEHAQEATDEFGIGHFSADWRETVTHPEVDLVVITTPPVLHREMALFAVENGRHVLCEKPMAMNAAEAEEMTAAAKGKPLLTLIDHEMRFQPGWLTARDLLRKGEIGKVRHAKWIFQAPHRGDPDLPWTWWSDVSAGGGALGAIASHIIDSLHWFLDTDISSIFCQLHTTIKERRDEAGKMRAVTSDDESNMLLRFADGPLTADATGLISVSMVEGPKYENSLYLYGTGGAMRILATGHVFLAKPGEADWTAIDVEMAPLVPGVPDTGFAAAFMAFAPLLVNAIREGRKADGAATFDDGLRVQRILDAARESDTSKCAVQPHLKW
jgi:predicted dehydrogenase